MKDFAAWDIMNSEIVMYLDFPVNELQKHLTVIKLFDEFDSTEYTFELEILPNQAPSFEDWDNIKLLSLKEK